MSSIRWSTKKVAVNGTPAAIIPDVLTTTTGVQLLANSGNVSTVFFGQSDLTMTSGYPLAPGASFFLPITHPNEIYCMTSGLVQHVHWICC